MAGKYFKALAALFVAAGSVCAQPSGPVKTPAPPPGPPPSSAVVDAPPGDWSQPAPAINSDLFWFQADYLLWWVRRANLPMLVGTAPIDEVVAATNGGSLTTINPLFGGGSNQLDYGSQSGLRLSGGIWLADDQALGVDGSFFQLEHGTMKGNFSSAGVPVIGPTFFDPVLNQEVLVLASLPAIGGLFGPGLRAATIEASTTNQLWGAELNLRTRGTTIFFADTLEWFVGVRHLQYNEGLRINTRTVQLSTDTAIDITDQINVLNQFWGGQLGLTSRSYVGPFNFDFVGKIALGGMQEISKFNGSSVFSGGGVPTQVFPGGILVEPTNTGRRTRTEFTYIPEIILTAGYQILPGVRATIGYNFLYVSRVARVGDQITGVDSRGVSSLGSFDPETKVTNPAPFGPSDSKFWAQGLNLGLEFVY
jgi:hypothetical protein